ncbi:reverse transcriptase/maturase family protein [Risungbinella massiliensis]|uniref:reverse transcriptase/maturase family protein n=1 Tax=Risungbinella massiliensis TaxID=1329796 RepID=UPI0005CBC695|nr:reverse transcriptase/maturase family protein [Risungbinella massiliensis]
MRSPIVVLDNLASKSTQVGYKYQRLYRNLYNVEFYLQAYNKLYAKEGNMTEGTDDETIDGMSLKRIEKIIEKIKDLSYQPKPVRRVHIPKKDGKTRPLGIPSFEDKLVQEVIRSILESIYEKKFSDFSHGFRKNKSCHTALHQAQKCFTGVKWFVEGDIKGFFDNINHHVLINILKKNINDEKFIDLIWKFLRAGYIEDWKFQKTYSGTPQGGIISPILANIYLNELDQYIEEYKQRFDKGTRWSRRNKVYRSKEHKNYKLRKSYNKIWNTLSEDQKSIAVREIKKAKKELMEIPYFEPMDKSFRRMHYVRYADDFVIGVIGSKEDCQKIKQDLTNFLMKHLSLELSQEKTLITHSSKKAQFLGYDLVVPRSPMIKYNSNGISQRYGMICTLLVPQKVWVDKLFQYQAIKMIPNTNKWRSAHRIPLVFNDDLEILETYNSEIRGMYNYYKLATNVSHSISTFKYYMEYSMYKTYANKYKSSVKKIIAKYQINGKFGVKYSTKSGTKTRFFYDQGLKRQRYKIENDPTVDNEPNALKIRGTRTSLMERLLATKCEWCGSENVPLEMHHVKKLKDLKGKKEWEKFMIARRRKTLALCTKCHVDLHAGKLD